MKTELEQFEYFLSHGFPKESDYRKAEQLSILIPVSLAVLGLIGIIWLLQTLLGIQL